MKRLHATLGLSSWRASAAVIFSLAVLFGGRAGAATADDAAGKFVFGALTKLNETPHHTFITSMKAGAAENESITVGGKNYNKLRGHWKVSRMTPAMAEERSKENLRNATVYRCEYERDEMLNGETAVVYKTHTESDLSVSDSEIWISKSRELPLRQVIVMSEDQRVTLRYDYDNVTAPELN